MACRHSKTGRASPAHHASFVHRLSILSASIPISLKLRSATLSLLSLCARCRQPRAGPYRLLSLFGSFVFVSATRSLPSRLRPYRLHPHSVSFPPPTYATTLLLYYTPSYFLLTGSFV
ncbi:hypothetical protein EDB83DRAFT_2495977, partial [Lactarius deliciosus]